MLSIPKVYAALEDKRAALLALGEANAQALHQYGKQLAQTEQDALGFNQQVLAASGQFAGALTTPDIALGLYQPLKTFFSQEEVSCWKDEILKDRITLAVDGSQIEPNKENGLFFGAVQAAWFVNPHNSSELPDKNVHFELVVPAPAEEERDFRQLLSFERTKSELQTLTRLIREVGAQGRPKRTVAFYDGSLSLSYTHGNPHQGQYIALTQGLLAASEEMGIPVVGFIDTSQAHNIAKSMQQAFGLQAAHISDAALLRAGLGAWGSRSAFFEFFDRQFEGAGGSGELGFCYVRTSTPAYIPARLELPLWVYNRGLLSEVVQVVLAESLVGGGYPYCFQVADQLAAISIEERGFFAELMARKGIIREGLSGKQKSKNLRRHKTIRV